jgi:hypothetical protein
MTWDQAHTIALRHALLIVGALCIVAGLLVRNIHGGDLRGLSSALIIVGILLAIADPAGRLTGLW